MKNNMLFTHGCSNEGNRFTIAVTLEKTDTEINSTFGISICSKNDSFSKKIGRAISEGRAKKDPILRGCYENTESGFKDVKTDMFNLCKYMEENIIAYKKIL